jgi:hypothetical protein
MSITIKKIEVKGKISLISKNSIPTRQQGKQKSAFLILFGRNELEQVCAQSVIQPITTQSPEAV